MASGTIFGLALIGAGLLVILISTIVTNVSANAQAYMRPQLDKAEFRRRNVRGVRFMGLVWIVSKLDSAIFGLVTGK